MRTFLIAILGVTGQICPALEETGGRTARVVYPERPGDAPRSVFLFNGKESLGVTFPSKNLSGVIDLPPGELSVVMTPGRIDDPENLPADAPRLSIAGEVGDFYILVTPDPENPVLPVRMILMRPDDGNLKPGETLWYNRTELRISAKLGEKNISFEPEEFTVTEAPVQESGHYRAEFSFQKPGQEASHRITEQQWWHDVKSRHVGFIVNSGGKLPKIFFYRDFRQPEREDHGGLNFASRLPMSGTTRTDLHAHVELAGP